jgi:D-lactate dehydrogenase
VKKTEDFNYFPKMEGFDLNGKTLGVVGTGKIGKNVVKIAKGFGMNIVAYDLYPDLDFAKENNFEYKSLEDVAKMSDVITLHTPYNKENHHLINKNIISLMKKGVCLVNTARGELIDTFALVDGLKNGIILGFATDVLEGERILKEKRGFFDRPSKEEENLIKINHELMEMPNVIITPHVAFFTLEAVASIQKTTIENIEGFLSGALINLVN